MASESLKKMGLKVTLPRLKVLAILEHNKDLHMSAEDVYKALLDSDEDVGLATVYRVLGQFEEAGLIDRHHFESGHSVYELKQGEHHDHMLCVHCGSVEEFVDKAIEERQMIIAKQAGYELIEHCLYIYGICPACRKKNKEQ